MSADGPLLGNRLHAEVLEEHGEVLLSRSGGDHAIRPVKHASDNNVRTTMTLRKVSGLPAENLPLRMGEDVPALIGTPAAPRPTA